MLVETWGESQTSGQGRIGRIEAVNVAAGLLLSRPQAATNDIETLLVRKGRWRPRPPTIPGAGPELVGRRIRVCS